MLASPLHSTGNQPKSGTISDMRGAFFVCFTSYKEEVHQQNLEHYFGYSSLQPLQTASLNILDQHHNLLAILPTGFGKSMIYQLFGLSQSGLTIVISPLIALVFDQVRNLQGKNLSAAAWNCLTPPNVKYSILRQLKENRLKFLYLSPEKLTSSLVSQHLMQTNVSQLVVDEAHCIPQWGPDFRPHYQQIGKWLGKYQENQQHRPILSAFTATADRDMAQEITNRLNLKKPIVITQACFRENLCWQIIPVPSQNWKRQLCRHILETWLKHPKPSSADICLIYAATRLDVYWICLWLQQHGFPQTQYFHAGLSQAEKVKILTDVSNTQQGIVVCTNAFGMGIDLPHVRLVIHLTPPTDMAAYVQETGRAGRDGQKAWVVTLFQPDDWLEQLELRLQNSAGKFRERKFQRAQAVWQFLHEKHCLSRFIVHYFRLPETPKISLQSCQCMHCHPQFPWNPK